MKPVPDRKKMRQEYIGTRFCLYCVSLMLPIFNLAAVGMAILTLLLALMMWQLGHWTEQDRKLLSECLSATACITFNCWVFWRHKRKFKRIASKIGYVPPVTPDTLPSEEVLVRGAEEPSASSETLLRATVEGEERKAGELLRSNEL